MKLWYQTVSSLDRRPAYKQALTEHANRLASEGTVVEAHGTRTGWGGEEFDGIRYFDVAQLLENAIAAERGGYDAFIIGNTLSSALFEARQLVEIPVVDHLQTALATAKTMADRFSIVVNHRRFARVWEKLVHRHGYGSHLVSVEGFDLEVTDYDKLYSDPDFEAAHVERILDAARRSVDAGSELVIVFPHSAFLRVEKAGHHDVDGAPIMNTIFPTIRAAETIVKYRELTGHFISRKYTYESPPKELIDQLIADGRIQVDLS